MDDQPFGGPQAAAPHSPAVRPLGADAVSRAPYPASAIPATRVLLDPARPWLEAGRSVDDAADVYRDYLRATSKRRAWRGPTFTEQTMRANAEAARRTAALVEPLRALGWTPMHDRIVPGTGVVVDTVLVGPTGIVLLDSHLYSPANAGLVAQTVAAAVQTLTFAGNTILTLALAQLPTWTLSWRSNVVEHGRPAALVNQATSLQAQNLNGWIVASAHTLEPLAVSDLTGAVEDVLPHAQLNHEP